MKLFIIALAGTLSTAGAFADSPRFDAHITCSAPDRKIELFLNQFGHPQFGFRYNGIGILSYGGRYPSKQFYLSWDFVDGKPLTATVHDDDGLGSWTFQMVSDKTQGFGDSTKPVYVTEFPESCSMPCDSMPLVYEATCQVQ